MAEAKIALNTGALQARLMKRYWVAAGSSLLVLLLMFVLYWGDYLAGTGFWITAGGMLFWIAFYYALFRSQLNLKAADPSLTIPQVLSAILMLTIAMFYTGSEARPVILLTVLMAFVFGVFRLPMPKLVGMALIAIAGYVVMIVLLVNFRAEDVDLRLEILRLTVFGIVLLWFAVMGGYISRLRKTLSDSRAAVEELATHDPLTGVYNRRHLSATLQQEKLRGDRSGDVFCVVILDLDFFKNINDTFGHQAGDEVLKTCAGCGSREVRPLDCFGRYGGEEFELLLIQTDLEGARIVAERIRNAMNRLSFPQISPDLRVTVSIGLAQYRPKEEIHETEKRADVALYRAKAAGRNRCEVEGA